MQKKYLKNTVHNHANNIQINIEIGTKYGKLKKQHF